MENQIRWVSKIATKLGDENAISQCVQETTLNVEFATRFLLDSTVLVRTLELYIVFN